VLVAVSKGMRAGKLHQQNPPVLNCRCQLTQVDLYNGRKTLVTVVVYVNKNVCNICLKAECKLFQEGGCSVPVAVNSDIQDGKVCTILFLR